MMSNAFRPLIVGEAGSREYIPTLPSSRFWMRYSLKKRRSMRP